MKIFTLYDGTEVPAIAFGTYNPHNEDMETIVEKALGCGYRFIDTASLYGTERAVGEAVRKSGISREKLVLQTKLWFDEMGYEGARRAVERSLSRLGTDYIDLMLIHWPKPYGSSGDDWKKLDADTWKALEDMADEGKIRSIGCSNFLPHHLENLLKGAKIKPSVDQLEIHIGYTQDAAVEYCRAHGIIPEAWGSLGRGKMGDFAGRAYVEMLAEKYGKSVQQIFLRFLLDRGVLPIAKAASEKHMKENMDVFDFALTDEEIWTLRCMPQDSWMGEHPDFHIPAKKSDPLQ